MKPSLFFMRMCGVLALYGLAACTQANDNAFGTHPSGMSDAEQLEAVVRAGNDIEAARNAPFDEAQFGKALSEARRPFDECVQDQIDLKLPKMSPSALTPAQKANGLLGECRPKLQPVYDLIYGSPLANNPAESRKVTDDIWSDGRQRIIDAI
jgi:hypothetical protein